eukprot:SAG31_NODE_3359_length_4366_cov_64.369815_2_plen_167_part_00
MDRPEGAVGTAQPIGRPYTKHDKMLFLNTLAVGRANDTAPTKTRKALPRGVRIRWSDILYYCFPVAAQRWTQETNIINRSSQRLDRGAHHGRASTLRCQASEEPPALLWRQSEASSEPRCIMPVRSLAADSAACADAKADDRRIGPDPIACGVAAAPAAGSCSGVV